jgi:hypothetical protein
MTTFKIFWGHSGTQGREWTTAREASRYACELWGEIDAINDIDAIHLVEADGVDVGDWFERDGEIHIIPAV